VGPGQLDKIQYYSSVSGLYILTLLFALLAFRPYLEPASNVIKVSSYTPSSLMLLNNKQNLVYGQPGRIIIPASNIDIPVNPGYYDSLDSSWTLSGYDAQFATISAVANNVAGDTFIYGHNNDFVFGSLRHNTPTPGSEALIYTTNNHILVYDFKNAYSLSPDNTSVLNYTGPPILTIQTCTGSLNEWRTMYQYDYVRTIQ
jgi:hypothetical protein